MSVPIADDEGGYLVPAEFVYGGWAWVDKPGWWNAALRYFAQWSAFTTGVYYESLGREWKYVPGLLDLVNEMQDAHREAGEKMAELMAGALSKIIKELRDREQP